MAAAEPEPDNSEEDDAKRKFREALERKRGQQAARKAGGQGRGSARLSGTHGPVKSQRQFRRKSG